MKEERINGENILYHILQKQIIEASDAINPPKEVKYMIEWLLLWGGVWFTPETYAEIPVLLPYVVRDANCRKIIPSTGKHTWGQSNAKGFLKDDNSLIKSIPTSLKINSCLSEMNGKKLGTGFVASHIWIDLASMPGIHACNWECTNSFIPNLVWLPKQLSKLTDRNGSYAQQFLQHISGLLYHKIAIKNPRLSPRLPGIWKELQDPGITPASGPINLKHLNYFEHDVSWVTKWNNKLNTEMQSILDIIGGASPTVKIKTSAYAPSLAKIVPSLSAHNKKYLIDWLTANM